MVAESKRGHVRMELSRDNLLSAVLSIEPVVGRSYHAVGVSLLFNTRILCWVLSIVKKQWSLFVCVGILLLPRFGSTLIAYVY